MNILKAILGAGDGQAVGALAQQFGLSNDQASSSFNDMNKDGSVADDVAGSVGKLFGSK